MGKKDPTLVSASIILTENCNLNCSYCFEKDKCHSKYMTKEVMQKTIDLLIKNAIKGKEDRIDITFFGGEPLLNMDVMEFGSHYMVEECKKNNLQFNIGAITNATIMTEQFKRILLFWYKSMGRVNLQLSIDGIPEIQNTSRRTKLDTDSSNMVESFVKELLSFFDENGIEQKGLNVHSVVVPETAHKMYENYLYFHEVLGIEYMWNLPCPESDWTKESLNVYEDQLKMIVDNIYDKCVTDNTDKYLIQYASLNKRFESRGTKSCGAGFRYMSVDTEGNIYPCHHFFFTNKDNLNEVCIGNVFDGVEDSKRQVFIDYEFKNVLADGYCGDCSNYGCYHCIAKNYEYSKNILIADPRQCTVSRLENKYRQLIQGKLKELNLLQNTANSYREKSSTSCSCGNNDKKTDELIDILMKDREALNDILKVYDENILALNNKIQAMDEKIMSLLDVTSTLAAFIVSQYSEKKNE